jgi:hypothetical protein
MDRLTPETFREGSIHSVGIEALSGPKKVVLWAITHEDEQRIWQVGTKRQWLVNGQGVSGVLKDIRNAWQAAGVLVRYWTVYPYAPAIRPHFQEREMYRNAQHGGAINAYLVFERRTTPAGDSMDEGDTVNWYVRTDCRPEDVRCVDDVLPAEEARDILSGAQALAEEILGWLAGFGLRYATPLSAVSPTGRTCVSLGWRWSGKRFFAVNRYYLDC